MDRLGSAEVQAMCWALLTLELQKFSTPDYDHTWNPPMSWASILLNCASAGISSICGSNLLDAQHFLMEIRCAEFVKIILHSSLVKKLAVFKLSQA